MQACQTLGSTNEGKALASALATELERGQRPDLIDLWYRFRALSLEDLQRLYAVGVLRLTIPHSFIRFSFISYPAFSANECLLRSL